MTARSVTLTTAAIGALVCCALGCGGGQTRGHPLDSSWDDESGAELASFVASWEQPTPKPSAAVMMGVVDPTQIVGYAYDRGARWELTYPFESRPVLAGNVVVGMGEGYLFALDAVTGERLWRRRALGWLRGVGDDGQTTVVSIESMSGVRSTVMAVDRDGNMVRQFYETATVGAPAVFDEFAFLPYGQGFVVIFDLIRGTELARVVADRPVTRAFIAGEELYFGEDVAIRFDRRIVEARDGGGSTFAPPELDVLSSPRWLLPGDTPLPLHTTQSDSVRIVMRPEKRPVLMYHRLIVGLDQAGHTRWVHTGDHSFVGGDAGEETIALCDTAGRLLWLDDENGTQLAVADGGLPLASCVIQNRGPPRLEPDPLPPLEDQLHDALSRVDPLHLPMQLSLLDDLAAIEGDRATAFLIQLAQRKPTRHGAADVLRERAAELLARRSTGHRAIVDALRSFASHWEAHEAPVAALARAARRNGIAEAAEPLAQALHQPRAEPEELEAIAEALAALAGAEQRSHLSLFVGRFACTDNGPAIARAVKHAKRALRRLGARRVLDAIEQTCDAAPAGASSPDAGP